MRAFLLASAFLLLAGSEMRWADDGVGGDFGVRRVLLVLLVERLQHPQLRYLVRRLPERHRALQEGPGPERPVPHLVSLAIILIIAGLLPPST